MKITAKKEGEGHSGGDTKRYPKSAAHEVPVDGEGRSFKYQSRHRRKESNHPYSMALTLLFSRQHKKKATRSEDTFPSAFRGLNISKCFRSEATCILVKVRGMVRQILWSQHGRYSAPGIGMLGRRGCHFDVAGAGESGGRKAPTVAVTMQVKEAVQLTKARLMDVMFFCFCVCACASGSVAAWFDKTPLAGRRVLFVRVFGCEGAVLHARH